MPTAYLLGNLDLVRLLRGQPGWGRLPIVLLTARAGSEAMIEGLTGLFPIEGVGRGSGVAAG